ncbi:hypothetical protein [Methylocucumis oryzae]|uniref:Uncharacterized protein n=1 Tax=Methylocucumis oryzae TaxID=1632867 RepID=A0A0F3IDW3_9GAMM|nr:hypothetical protein [Methylocucumis oryzae]KJV04956.1 hypothetical protein VZ94_21600 [Methylocucumis oryzae]
MDDSNAELLELAKKIVSSLHSQNHLNEFEPIGVKNNDDMVQHVYKTLLSQETKLTKCAEGVKSTNAGVCFAYNEKTNTMIVFHPDKNDFTHTVYRPNDGKERFDVKVRNITIAQGGQTPEIKRGIFELMPELEHKAHKKQEQKTQSNKSAEAERAREEQLKRILARRQRSWELERNGGREFEPKSIS